jgi:hypothetical protein
MAGITLSLTPPNGKNWRTGVSLPRSRWAQRWRSSAQAVAKPRQSAFRPQPPLFSPPRDGARVLAALVGASAGIQAQNRW